MVLVKYMYASVSRRHNRTVGGEGVGDCEQGRRHHRSWGHTPPTVFKALAPFGSYLTDTLMIANIYEPIPGLFNQRQHSLPLVPWLKTLPEYVNSTSVHPRLCHLIVAYQAFLEISACVLLNLYAC